MSDQLAEARARTEVHPTIAQIPPRAVHVKNVPGHVWRHARQNAMASGMPFKEFVIHLLANSSPVC